MAPSVSGPTACTLGESAKQPSRSGMRRKPRRRGERLTNSLMETFFVMRSIAPAVAKRRRDRGRFRFNQLYVFILITKGTESQSSGIFLESVFALLYRNRRIPDRTMRPDKDAGRSSATPEGRPTAPHQSEARGARPFVCVRENVKGMNVEGGALRRLTSGS